MDTPIRTTIVKCPFCYAAYLFGGEDNPYTRAVATHFESKFVDSTKHFNRFTCLECNKTFDPGVMPTGEAIIAAKTFEVVFYEKEQQNGIN